jgi:ribosome biogenesis protein BMS1
MEASDVRPNKVHRAPRAGAKADKKKEKDKKGKDTNDGRKDNRAFGVAKFGRVHRTMQRNVDMSHRKEHVEHVDRGADKDVKPPVVVVVMGPPGSGKSTLIKVSASPSASDARQW